MAAQNWGLIFGFMAIVSGTLLSMGVLNTMLDTLRRVSWWAVDTLISSVSKPLGELWRQFVKGARPEHRRSPDEFTTETDFNKWVERVRRQMEDEKRFISWAKRINSDPRTRWQIEIDEAALHSPDEFTTKESYMAWVDKVRGQLTESQYLRWMEKLYQNPARQFDYFPKYHDPSWVERAKNWWYKKPQAEYEHLRDPGDFETEAEQKAWVAKVRDEMPIDEFYRWARQLNKKKWAEHELLLQKLNITHAEWMMHQLNGTLTDEKLYGDNKGQRILGWYIEEPFDDGTDYAKWKYRRRKGEGARDYTKRIGKVVDRIEDEDEFVRVMDAARKNLTHKQWDNFVKGRIIKLIRAIEQLQSKQYTTEKIEAVVEKLKEKLTWYKPYEPTYWRSPSDFESEEEFRSWVLEMQETLLDRERDLWEQYNDPQRKFNYFPKFNLPTWANELKTWWSGEAEPIQPMYEEEYFDLYLQYFEPPPPRTTQEKLINIAANWWESGKTKTAKKALWGVFAETNQQAFDSYGKQGAEYDQEQGKQVRHQVDDYYADLLPKEATKDDDNWFNLK
jgi:hypothetical protein